MSPSPKPSSPDPAGAIERYLILGTAGHIDHGKTVLIKALTGIDTDCLPEEKRRGITIELGFAHLDLGSTRLGIVDVPGHERFVRTMVAGALGVDLALLVVAADDSVMPQTREHVEILDLLNITEAVVAITKCDLVDAEMVEWVEEEVGQLLTGTTLVGAKIVPVSAITGQGLDSLRQALTAAGGRIEQSGDAGPFRLAIDRVFAVPGRGPVVTGSVLQGGITVGEVLELLPGQLAARARGLQAHGQTVERVQRGQRAAINLAGIDQAQIERGHELAASGYLVPTRWLDVELRCLASSPGPIKSRSQLRLGIATRELLVRVVTPDGQPIGPGNCGWAQLRLPQSVAASYGQRFIVRHETAVRTVGGGRVLGCAARRRSIRGDQAVKMLEHLASADPLVRLEQVLVLAGFEPPGPLHLAAQAGLDPQQIPELLAQLWQGGRLIELIPGDPVVPQAAVYQLCVRAQRWLERFHQLQPDQPGIACETLIGYLDRKSRRSWGRLLFERMLAAGQVRQLGRFVAHPDHAVQLSSQDHKVLAAVLNQCAAAGFAPPTAPELQAVQQASPQRLERLIKYALATGELIEVDGQFLLHATCERQLRRCVTKLIEREGSASVSTIRQALGTSRKYAVPLVEYLDRIGFTVRQGDRRVLAAKARE